MKVYWKYFAFPLIYGVIFSWYSSFHSKKMLQIYDVVGEINGEYLNYINPASVCAMLEIYIPFFLFVIVFSTYIYRHFCNSSVYIFSRCKNRTKWYAIEIIKLFVFTFLNTSIILCGYFATAIVANKLIISLSQMKFVIWYLALYTLWSFHIVLLANIVSILKGGIAGNMVSLSLQIISTIALLTVNCAHLYGSNLKRLVWNPNAYLFANYYSIKLNGKKILGILPHSLSVTRGFLMTGMCCVIVICLGAVVVSRIDIIQSNKEL